MAGDKWFRPKRFGYGATPDNWKGWAFMVVYIAIVVVLSLMLIHAGTAAWLVVLAVLALTVAIMPLIKAKTHGEWRWRWH